MRAKGRFFPRLFFFRKKFVTLYSKSKHHIAMKKIFYLMLLCATISGASSCSKYDIETNDLIGKWESTEVIADGTRTLYESLTFNDNGICQIETLETINNWEEPEYDNSTVDPDFPTGVIPDNIVGMSNLTYTYSLVDDVLYLLFTGDYPSISKETAYIVSIKKNTLTLTNYKTSKTYTKAN